MHADRRSPTRRDPELLGQTVVVIGGSAGMGLETARLARAEGADVVLTGRDPDRLRQAAQEIGAGATAAFDATDSARLERFFEDLPGPVDHVLVTGPGPYYAPLAEMDFDRARHASTRTSGCPCTSPARPSAGSAPAARCSSSAAPAAAVAGSGSP